MPAGGLERVTALAIKLLDLKQHKADLEEDAKNVGEAITRLESEDLPSTMTELGLKDFTLTDGNRVTIKSIVAASLPSMGSILREKDSEKAATMRMRLAQGFKYLREHGAGALIKQVLEADLGKDSDVKKALALKALSALGIQASIVPAVHSASLTAWCKERIAAGSEVDFDLFQIFSGSKAVIEKPKDKK
jgi:hypothetical protein